MGQVFFVFYEKCLRYLCIVNMKNLSPTEFGILFGRYRTKFVSVAMSYVHSKIDAEDIVSEAFTKFWDLREKVDIKGQPEAYILTMIRNKCLNYIRDKAGRARIENNIKEEEKRAMQSDIYALERMDADVLFDQDFRKLFKNILHQLPEQRRRIFSAVKFEGLTYNETALRLGISPWKVKREVSAAINSIRKALRDCL